MLGEWSQFAERHSISGGVLLSLLWFFAGKQSLSNGRADAACFWQSVGLIILLILCGLSIREGHWFGLSFIVVILGVEAWWIRNTFAARRNQRKIPFE
jgi:hypothetical protein